MFQTKIVEKIKTHILCSITFCRARQATYDSMAQVHCSTNTYPECVILIDLPLQQ